MRIRQRLLLSTLAVFVVTPAHGAFAQDGGGEQAANEEIIVTATKRARNVQNVPIAIEVVSQEKLEKTGTTDLLQLAQKVPGLSVRTGNAGNVLRMRGIGSSPFGNTEQSVALYKDGIFIGKARQNQMPFFDVLRIEVLRGPQGALIGKNSSAGALNFLSNNPTDMFEAGITANYLFDYDGVDIAGYVSGPISETLSARLAMKYRDTTGQLLNLATGKDEPRVDSIQGRLSFRFRPSDHVDMLTKLEYAKVEGIGHNFFGLPLTYTTYRDALKAVIDAGAYNAPPIVIPGPDGRPFTREDADALEQFEFANTLTIDNPSGLSFVSTTGFISYSSYMSTAGRHAPPFEILNTSYFEGQKQASQEFRLQSPVSETFDWVVGVYGDWSQFEITNPLIFDTRSAGSAPGVTPVIPPGAVTTRGVQRTRLNMESYTFSVFATGTWHIRDDLDLILGGRYTSVHKSGTMDYVTVFDSCPPPPEGAPTCRFPIAPFALEDSFTDSHFDPSITLQYNVTPDVMVYATFGQGSKPGTLQSQRTTTRFDFRLLQEVTTSYEIGVKSVIADFLTLNAAAYYMVMDDYQVGQHVVMPDGTSTLRGTNAATAISKGFELSGSANLDKWIPGLRLSGNVAYTDAFFDDYPGATCTAPAALRGCVSGRPFEGEPTFNGRGLPLQLVSKWAGSAGFDYARNLTGTIGLEISGSVDFYSPYYFDTSAYADATGLQPAGQIYNLRVGVADLDGKWSVALIGENLGEVWRGGQSYTYPGFPGTVRTYGIYGGRNLMLQASVKF